MTVCLLTYRRPADLELALPAVLEQAQSLPRPAQVLVVDNDPDAGAAGLVGSCTDRGVRYVHEPTPGIAAARNRALDEAASSDVIVFIDDDERPTEGWLHALVGTYLAERPSGVVGPVVSAFEQEPEAWIRAGGFFRRRQLTTGTLVDVAATNNLLLDLRELRRHGLRFDQRFGLTGGSDTLLTLGLTRAGGTLMWCAEAAVVDVVPAERATRRWVLRRAYRMGNSSSLVAVDLARGSGRRAQAVAGQLFSGSGRLIVGVLRVVLGTARGSVAQQASGARACARGAGLVAGVLGSSYVEYRRPSHLEP